MSIEKAVSMRQSRSYDCLPREPQVSQLRLEDPLWQVMVLRSYEMLRIVMMCLPVVNQN